MLKNPLLTILAGTVLLAGCGQAGTEQKSEQTTERQQQVENQRQDADKLARQGEAEEKAESDQPDAGERKAENPQGGTFEKERTTGPLSVASLTKEIKPGDTIKLSVKAAPNTPVNIETDGVAAESAGALIGKRTDDAGLAGWEWKLKSDYKADKVPVIITADYEDLDKKLTEQLDVALPKGTNANLASSFGAFNKSARPGDEVDIQIKTAPKASVDIQAHGVAITTPNQTADEKGLVSWKFKIGDNYEADKVPLIVTIKKDGKEQKLIGELAVSKIAATDKSKDKTL